MRVRQHPAVLYDDFGTELFQLAAAEARRMGTWLWEDAAQVRI